MVLCLRNCGGFHSDYSKNVLVSLFSGVFLFVAACGWATTWYVDDDAGSGGDGTSWKNAFLDIQSAIIAANETQLGDVWVAEGVYTSTDNYVIELKEGLTVYGGFDGNETSLDERDFLTNRSIIDGRGTVRCVKGAEGATLDGFYVENGHAGSGDSGGIYISQCSSVIRNCFVTNCLAPLDCGGGICVNYEGTATVENCTIKDCYADFGGGIYVGNESELTLLNSRVVANKGNVAGGIRTFKSTAHVTNCLLVGNNGSEGGAMNNYESTVNLLNCTVLNNESYLDGSVMRNDSDSTIYITNSILWDNERAINQAGGLMKSCCIDEDPEITTENIIQTAPMNCPASYRLFPDSPCIDGGDSSIEELPENDIYGEQRVQGAAVDIGACEYDLSIVPTELTIAIAPEKVLPLQPKWSLSSGLEGYNGQTIEIYPGDYELKFSRLGNWEVPEDRQMAVTPGRTTKVFEYLPSPGSRVCYVDGEATGNNNGTSWENAYADIQEAMNSLEDTEFMEVWVAAGTYTSNRLYVVEMAENTHLFGGFSGTEKNRDERNWVNNPTVIDGQYSCRGVKTVNHSTLDGFVIAQAINFGIFIESVSPVINHCIVRDTWGSGIYISYWSSRPFTSPIISNCLFTGNRTFNQGGGIDCHSKAAPIISSCTFVGNQASAGGALYKGSVNAVVDSCVIWGNSSGIEGNDDAVSYSCVQGGCPGVGNISSDPMLSPETFRPLPGSRCIDAGNPQFIDTYTTDLSVTARLENARIDMGAFEEDTPTELIEVVVSLSPSEILSENPRWRIKGYPWFDSGDALRLPPGEYNIEFYPVLHWQRPTVQTITVSESTQEFSFEYTQSPGSHCWYVDGSAVGENNGTSWYDAFTHIQPAIDRASEDGFGEVWIAEGTYTGDGGNVIEISDGVHLYGGFVGNESERSQRQRGDYLTIIDGKGIRRCVLAEGNYTLDGLTFANGKSDRGAGLCTAYSEPVIKNCIFQNNHAGGEHSQGGAIYSVNNRLLNMVNCLVVENSAYEGGAVYSDRSTGDYRSCTFMSNITYNSPYRATSSVSNITNSIFWEIEYSRAYYGKLNVSDCCSVYEFSGIDNILDDPMLDYFYRPLPDSPCIDVADPLASDLENLDLRGNSRTLGNGADLGAYEFVADDQVTTLTVTLGPLEELPSVPEWRLNNGPWQQGDSTVHLPSGTYRIEFSTIYGWSKPDVESITFTAPDADMHFDYTSLQLLPIVYVDSDATGNADGSSWENAFADIQSALEVSLPDGFGEVWVAEGTYTGSGPQVLEMKNQVHLYGGFAGNETERIQRDWETHHTVIDGQHERMCVRGADQSTLDGFIVTNGRAINGGGMYNQDNEVNLRNCSFTANSAEENGGALYINTGRDAMPAIESCFFLENSAKNGGGVYNAGSNVNTLALDQCYFFNNQADEKGGGVCTMGYRTINMVVNNGYFSGNLASNGGGVYSESKEMAFHECQFYDNNASIRGGGLYLRASRYETLPTISGCEFEGNHSDQDAGAVYVATGLQIVDSVFTVNTAGHDGGALRQGNGLSVRNCSFDQNEAGHDGGAVSGSPATIESCVFSSNRAGRMGGGVANSFSSASRVIKKSIFIENQAGYGGGISNYSYLELREELQNLKSKFGTEYQYSYSPDVVNSLFIRNKAVFKGDGIYNYSVRSEIDLSGKCQQEIKTTPPVCLGTTYYYYEAPMINHCTFIQSPGRSGIVSDWPRDYYYRSIFAGYISPWTGSYYDYHYLYQEPTVSNCINWQEGDTDNNPGFMNPSEDDYRLTAQSMYIDAGTLDDDTPDEDLRGFPRPNGEFPDQGAYEYYDTAYPPEIVFTLLDIVAGKDIYDLNGDGIIDAADLMME